MSLATIAPEREGQVALAEKLDLADPQVQKVMDWDLGQVRQRVIKIEGIDPEEAEAMEQEYRRFIAMIVLNPGVRFPISKQVDPFWHAHILFTLDYARMCEECNGGFIHHHPASDADVETIRSYYADNTMPAYRQMFGEPAPQWWPNLSQFTHCSHGCGC